MASDPRAGFDSTRLLVSIATALEDDDRTEALRLLGKVVELGEPSDAAPRLEHLCHHLESDPELAHRIGTALREWLVALRVGPALTESGIAAQTGFFSELFGRVVRRLLPDPEPSDDLREAIHRVLPSGDAWIRIEAVPDAIWARLLTAIGITADTVHGVDPELGSAIRTVAHHVGSLGMHPEFTRRLPYLEDPDSPFLEVTDRVLAYIRSYGNEVEGDEPPLLREALETIGRCRAEVEHLRATKGLHGTSLELTGITFRLIQLLDRLEVLLHLTDPVQSDFQASAIRLFRELVTAEKTKNRLRPVLRERADLLVYQVVEHAAKKGSKYITSGRSDYFAFFVASLGGGLIVALFSLVKTVVSGWGLPLGIEAIVYGLNYALCFVLIYLTGAALATKQPAMTANTIAKALGTPEERHLDELEALVVRVWRSQFVSFVGNLAMALPVAFLLSMAFFQVSGEPAADTEKALYMLGKLHPWQSGTIFFAAIAGAFLFLSGLISGWVDNRNLYSHLPDRIARHPLLVAVLGPKRSGDVANFVERNLGVILGNVFLGFALGSTGTLGEILGLPLDIRHIAFASAEFGTALEVLRLDVAWATVWPVIIGVFAIGLINFLVSFGLSLLTGLESRSITWKETRLLLMHLGRRFFVRPTDWFFPPKSPPPAAPEAAGPGASGSGG